MLRTNPTVLGTTTTMLGTTPTMLRTNPTVLGTTTTMLGTTATPQLGQKMHSGCTKTPTEHCLPAQQAEIPVRPAATCSRSIARGGPAGTAGGPRTTTRRPGTRRQPTPTDVPTCRPCEVAEAKGFPKEEGPGPARLAKHLDCRSRSALVP